MMKRRYIFCLLCLLCLMGGSSLWAASGDSAASPADSLKGFVKNLVTYNYMFPREQVYLHFDNTGYFMGETIWFKAYVVNPNGLGPTKQSRVLYVELLTPEGRVLQQQKLKIEYGQCHGQISLGELLHAGFYEVRAYTALMLNWEDAPVFSRVFPVFNAPKEEGEYGNPRMVKMPHSQRLHDKREALPIGEKLNVTFFPEGGTWVEGISSAVFFKATDKRGNAQEVEGWIVNQRGDTVCTLATRHQGMGRFELLPRAGESYHAEVMEKGGTTRQRFDLPTAQRQGYAMRVDNLRDDSVCVRLTRSEGTDGTRALGLTVMCRGRVVLFRLVDWQGRQNTVQTIARQGLPEGVNQLTLFDTEGHIHAERLFFVPPRGGMNVSLVDGKTEGLHPKEPLTMDFRATDRKGQPVRTVFSLSVRDADTETPTNDVCGGGSMRANLLLGSELKGYIHDIDHYLEADDADHRTDLDLLFCTQGWRKYDWEKMTRPQDFEVKHHIEEGIMVVGDLTSTFRNRKKEGVKIKVFLYNDAGYHLTASALTDSLGRFAFQAEDFTGRWEMHTLTYENGKTKEMNVNLNKMQSPKGRAFADGETRLFLHQPMEEETVTFLPDTLMEYDADATQKWENLLPTVNVEAQKEWQTAEVRRWHNAIYDMEDERMLMDETGEEYQKNFWEWLMQTNPFFGYTEIGPPQATITVPAYKGVPLRFRVKYVGTDNGTHQVDDWIFQPTEPAADGLGSMVENLTVNDVDAIAISDKPGANVAFIRDMHKLEGESTGAWVLDPTMDNGDYYYRKGVNYITLFVTSDYFRPLHKNKRGHRKTKIQGFSPALQFYLPDYSEADLPDERDFRRTLYWNPNVITDKEGNATVNFYNSPNCRRVVVSTEHW